MPIEETRHEFSSSTQSPDWATVRAVRALRDRDRDRDRGRAAKRTTHTLKAWSALFIAAVSITLITILVVPWAIDHRWWGARVEWGPASGYVAAFLTLLAIIVALLGNKRSQKMSREALSQSRASYALSERALEESQAKAVSDRVYSHRRENVKAVADMWFALDTFDSAVDSYRTARIEAQQHSANGPTPTQTAAEGGLSALRTVLVDASAKADAALMYARIITDSGPVLEHVANADIAFRALSHEVFHTPADYSYRGVDTARDWSRALEAHRQTLFGLRKTVVCHQHGTSLT